MCLICFDTVFFEGGVFYVRGRNLPLAHANILTSNMLVRNKLQSSFARNNNNLIQKNHKITKVYEVKVSCKKE